MRRYASQFENKRDHSSINGTSNEARNDRSSLTEEPRSVVTYSQCLPWRYRLAHITAADIDSFTLPLCSIAQLAATRKQCSNMVMFRLALTQREPLAVYDHFEAQESPMTNTTITPDGCNFEKKRLSMGSCKMWFMHTTHILSV